MHFLESGSQDQGWFLLRLSSPCVLTRPFFCVHASLWSLYLLGYQSYWIRTPSLWPYLTLIISLKVLSPTTVTWRVRASKYEWSVEGEEHNSVHKSYPGRRLTSEFQRSTKQVLLGSALLFSVLQFCLSSRKVHSHQFCCPSGKFSKTVSPHLDRGACVGHLCDHIDKPD